MIGVCPILQQLMRLHVVRQMNRQDLVSNGRFEGFVFHREESLHPPVEVSGHQVGTAQEDLLLTSVMEVVHPGMLQEPADDRGHSDIVADAFDPRSQTADPAICRSILTPAIEA